MPGVLPPNRCPPRHGRHAHGYTIVSKDDDFHHLSFLLGAPPKVIGIHLGNSTTADLELLLRMHHAELLQFAVEPATAFIALPPVIK